MLVTLEQLRRGRGECLTTTCSRRSALRPAAEPGVRPGRERGLLARVGGLAGVLGRAFFEELASIATDV